jgi:hypothetical protein
MTQKLRPFGQFITRYEGSEFGAPRQSDCIHEKAYSNNGNQWVCKLCGESGYGLIENERQERETD